MGLSRKIWNYLSFGAIISSILLASIIFYDVLFSKPVILKGIVVDKLFVPSKNTAGPNTLNYRRYKTFDHAITAQNHQQWIAFVKMKDGKVFKVNCHSDHYEKKQVGDTLHFKEYIGTLLGIDYFSHNEEDEELESSM